MFRRVLLAAVLSGIAAALVMSAVQHLRVTPLILEAEQYETGMAAMMAANGGEMPSAENQAQSHNHAAMAGHEHGEMMSGESLRRTGLTILANILTGIGFALVLGAISLIFGIPLTPANGALWGFLGFAAFSLAPSFGLPPELPGMPAADLVARQYWWAGTVLMTGAGMVLLAKRRALPAAVIAAMLIALPHLIGAPAPVTAQSAVPPHLAAAFAANALTTTCILWVLIGIFLGLSLNASEKDMRA